MELIALMPDVVLPSATPSVRAMQQVTRNVPIVFVLAPDPVGSGIVDSLPHPGGNVTGFTSNEFGLSVKWLELLKQIAPNISRWQYFETRQTRLGLDSLVPSRARRRRSGWR
jgi:putative ABC transport system substrate-binding protein